MSKNNRIALSLVIVSLGILFVVGAANSHEWYDQYCCNNTDCAEIPSTSVKAIEGGFQVVLNPGDHPLVTEKQEFFVPYEKGSDGSTYEAVHRTSKDQYFHACLFPTQENLRCFYSPPMGF